jgi:hypothetical protein
MTVTFPLVKHASNYNLKTGIQPQHLRLTILHTKKPENLVLSPTLRILAIMIRRGVLDGITTIDELLRRNDLDSAPMKLTIKQDWLDKPIFLAGLPGGRGVKPDVPMNTPSLNQFFKLRAINAGYPAETSFYAWRRGAATNMDRAEGVSRETVRAFMGHTAGGTTFEDHYNNPAFDLDVNAIALGEEVDKEMGMSIPSLVRVTVAISAESLEDFMKRFVEEDADVKSAVTAAERKNAVRRSRHRARLALQERLQNHQGKAHTIFIICNTDICLLKTRHLQWTNFVPASPSLNSQESSGLKSAVSPTNWPRLLWIPMRLMRSMRSMK